MFDITDLTLALCNSHRHHATLTGKANFLVDLTQVSSVFPAIMRPQRRLLKCKKK